MSETDRTSGRPGWAASHAAVHAARDYLQRREMTLEERLAEERILFLWGEISSSTAGGLIMRLLELQSKSPDREIHLYINSPGGDVDNTLAIYDQGPSGCGQRSVFY